MNCVLNSYPLSPKQLEFINAYPRSGSGVSITHLCAGRGFGKTQIEILKAWRAATELNPGCDGAITMPVGPDFDKTFWPLWEKIIPGDFWTRRRTSRKVEYIDIPLWGSRIFLISREIRNKRSEPGRGPNLAWVIHDEAAKDPDGSVIQEFRGAVRVMEAPCKFADSVSTPKPGWYKRLLLKGEKTGRSRTIYATSFDNPYRDREWLEGLKEDGDGDYIKQELLAQWVARAARIWKRFSEADWPDGNMVEHSWDASQPYYLAVDLGQRSAWLLMQSVQAHDAFGNPKFPGALDVVVAEWQPNDGDVIRMVKRIHEFTGGKSPSKIFTGQDVNTRNYATGVSCTTAFRNMGWQAPFVLPDGDGRTKEVQFYALSGLIHNVKNWRRFCVSKHLISHNPENCRGVLDVMSDDGWPEKPTGDYLPKDKQTTGYEDTRDALLYYAIARNPPRAQGSATHAA